MLMMRKEKGFTILGVILVVVVALVAVSVWTMSGENNISSLKGNADVIGAGVVNDATNLQLAYNNLIMNGVSPASIVMLPNTSSTATSPNLLDPNSGAPFTGVNSNVVRAGAEAIEGVWVYNPTGFSIAEMGTPTPDPTIMMVGIKDSICKQINYSIYGSTNIPMTGGPRTPSPATLITGATLSSPLSTFAHTMSNSPYSTWRRGCLKIANKTDWNMYFQILQVM